MTEQIKKSNYYLYYKNSLFMMLIIYIILFFMFLVILMPTLSYLDNIVVLLMFIGYLGLFSLIFLPFIIYYLYKLRIVNKNLEDYKRYEALITNIQTPVMIRANHREVTLNIELLNINVTTRVYKSLSSNLYDDIGKNQLVKVAYNKKIDSTIILNVI